MHPQKLQDKFLIIESLLEMALRQFDTDHESARYGISRSLNLIRNVKKYSVKKGEDKPINEKNSVRPPRYDEIYFKGREWLDSL